MDILELTSAFNFARIISNIIIFSMIITGLIGSFFWGWYRKTVKSAIALAFTLLSIILASIVTQIHFISLSKNIAEFISDEPQVMEYLSKVPEIVTYIIYFCACLAAILFYTITYLLIFGLTKIAVHFSSKAIIGNLQTNALSENTNEFISKDNDRIYGGIISVINLLVFSIGLCGPTFSFFNNMETYTDKLLQRTTNITFQTKELEEGLETVNDVYLSWTENKSGLSSALMKGTSACGGKLILDSFTHYKNNGNKMVFSKSIDDFVNLSAQLINVIDEDISSEINNFDYPIPLPPITSSPDEPQTDIVAEPTLTPEPVLTPEPTFTPEPVITPEPTLTPEPPSAETVEQTTIVEYINEHPEYRESIDTFANVLASTSLISLLVSENEVENLLSSYGYTPDSISQEELNELNEWLTDYCNNYKGSDRQKRNLKNNLNTLGQKYGIQVK